MKYVKRGFYIVILILGEVYVFYKVNFIWIIGFMNICNENIEILK